MTPVERADLEEYLRQALADPVRFHALERGHEPAQLPAGGRRGGDRLGAAAEGIELCGHVPAPIRQERIAGAPGSLPADAY